MCDGQMNNYICIIVFLYDTSMQDTYVAPNNLKDRLQMLRPYIQFELLN